MGKYPQVDLKQVKTSPLSDRKNLVDIADFARPIDPGATAKSLIHSLPKILAGNSFREAVTAVVKARNRKKGVIFAMGAHLIKCGLSPIVIDLMQNGIVTAVALNGAGVVHDVEVALIGKTSESVQDGIKDGSFGMARETGEFINLATVEGARQDMGLGEVLGSKLAVLNPPNVAFSILAAGERLKIPVTVHVALGTDIIHTHPTVDGAAIGATSMTDFRVFASAVSTLEDGGVYFNIGSAVMLPEVFLKALAVVRNLGHNVQDFTTVNLDFVQHYRPGQNVVARPTSDSRGRGIQLTGHHEIMIPLLACAIKEELQSSSSYPTS